MCKCLRIVHLHGVIFVIWSSPLRRCLPEVCYECEISSSYTSHILSVLLIIMLVLYMFYLFCENLLVPLKCFF